MTMGVYYVPYINSITAISASLIQTGKLQLLYDYSQSNDMIGIFSFNRNFQLNYSADSYITNYFSQK